VNLRRRARKDERGAAAVEFALIALPLILLMFIIVESAFLMKDYVSVSSAVRTGARSASASADGGPGTCVASASPPPCTPANAPAFAQGAADSIQTTATSLNSEDIEFILIYEPGSNGFPIGQSTLTCGSNCVKYIWDSGLNKFRYASGSWASASVNACLNDPQRDSVGVGMKVSHSMVSGVFGTTMNLEERTLMQFEPLAQDVCKPGTPSPHP
jgi:Flp pilus assembly pilin Flp